MSPQGLTNTPLPKGRLRPCGNDLADACHNWIVAAFEGGVEQTRCTVSKIQRPRLKSDTLTRHFPANGAD